LAKHGARLSKGGEHTENGIPTAAQWNFKTTQLRERGGENAHPHTDNRYQRRTMTLQNDTIERREEGRMHTRTQVIDTNRHDDSSKRHN